MVAIRLRELAERLGGRLVGDSDPEIVNALPLQDAYAGCLTLVDHPKQVRRLAGCEAAAVVVGEVVGECSIPQLVVADPRAKFELAIKVLRPVADYRSRYGIHPSAAIDGTAIVGHGAMIQAGVTIGPRCKIGQRCVLHPGVAIMAGCTVGDDCEIFPHATLYPQTIVGNRVLIHAGAVLGAYGFGYRLNQGCHERTAQLGWVELGDDVEIGACATVDRGTYGATKIGQGTKLDNHVQIGHNCHIGDHNLICAQVGIAGSTVTGHHVVLAGQVGIADHVRLADNVTVGAQAGVIGDLEEGEVVVGSPAVPRRRRMLEWALIAKLPEMRKELKDLQTELDELRQSQQAQSSDSLRRRSA